MEIIHCGAENFLRNILNSDLSNTCIISFTNRLNNLNLKNYLYFDKVLEGIPDELFIKCGYNFFDKSYKEKVLNFIKEKNYSKVICVCDAGLCRSFSLAISLRYLYNLECFKYTENVDCMPDENIITCVAGSNFYEKIREINDNKHVEIPNFFDEFFKF